MRVSPKSAREGIDGVVETAQGPALTVRVRKDSARLELLANGDAELEVWATGRHITPFEAVVGQPVKLVMTQAPPPPTIRRRAASATPPRRPRRRPAAP